MKYCNYMYRDVTSVYSLNSRKLPGRFSHGLGTRLAKGSFCLQTSTHKWHVRSPKGTVLGLGLLFPKYYLIFFPKLLLYYSLRVDPLFHEILLTVSQKWPKQTRQKYTCYTNPTQKSIKDLILSKLLVDSMVDQVAEWVDTGHSETESVSTKLTIYISMADSVKFRWSLELFFGWLCKLLFVPRIILIPSTAYYSGNYSRTIGSGLHSVLARWEHWYTNIPSVPWLSLTGV